MWELIIPTIVTSTADSFNPIAITQQFVLQGMVKKPKHIWYFIVPTGITNLLGGYFAYYGLIHLISIFFNRIIEKYGQILFISEFLLAIALFIFVGYLIQSNRVKKQLNELNLGEQNNDENTEVKVASKIKSVSPMALVALGVGATISELTTALPYFAFLAIIFKYQLSFLQLSFILILYNIIYTLPLMILYFIYIKAQGKFDQIYTVIKGQITKWSNILSPALFGIVGIILFYHSLTLLLL